jgi:hypothetical protein
MCRLQVEEELSLSNNVIGPREVEMSNGKCYVYLVDNFSNNLDY